MDDNTNFCEISLRRAGVLSGMIRAVVSVFLLDGSANKPLALDLPVLSTRSEKLSAAVKRNAQPSVSPVGTWFPMLSVLASTQTSLITVKAFGIMDVEIRKLSLSFKLHI